MGRPQARVSRTKAQRRILRVAAIYRETGNGEGTGAAAARFGPGVEVPHSAYRREVEENRKAQEGSGKTSRQEAGDTGARTEPAVGRAYHGWGGGTWRSETRRAHAWSSGAQYSGRE